MHFEVKLSGVSIVGLRRSYVVIILRVYSLCSQSVIEFHGQNFRRILQPIYMHVSVAVAKLSKAPAWLSCVRLREWPEF